MSLREFEGRIAKSIVCTELVRSKSTESGWQMDNTADQGVCVSRHSPGKGYCQVGRYRWKASNVSISSLSSISRELRLGPWGGNMSSDSVIS
jgi:hypothetical protein